MQIISVNNLAYGYEGGAIVNGLSFTVSEGDFLSVLGDNGSGKSTLMKTLLGLHRPSSGVIEFQNGLKASEIGYLPQQTPVQRDFPASVREVVLSGFSGKLRGPFYSAEQKKKAKENIEKMGIEKLSGKCYRELSGGQQQRVLLARALCAAEKVLVMDEPVSGLDPNATADFYSLIQRLNKEDGKTIIMVSHDVDCAVRYSSHILHIGCHIFFGTAHEFRHSSAVTSLICNEDHDEDSGHASLATNHDCHGGKKLCFPGDEGAGRVHGAAGKKGGKKK